MNDTHFICTVCNKRWGIEKEGSDVELTRCDKHKQTLTSRENTAMGGKYLTMAERMQKIKSYRSKSLD